MAPDIPPVRSSESDQRVRVEDLTAALQCYEIALRNSNVTVFTQDRKLRYSSISNTFLGFEIKEIVGRTDEDIIPAENRQLLIAIKQEALETGLPKDSEVQIKDGSINRWFDFHIEPLRNASGEIVGLTCAAVDITERKENEEHLRLLMREITHRSKNLLAVVQALARQTARYSSSIDGFLERFGARLQALAHSHDLLVQEGWHGVSLDDLVRSQLSDRLNQGEGQVSVAGSALRLRPEAAQRLGLGLHELAVNAAKYGALSTPSGRLSIAWSKRAAADGGGVEITWAESGGPIVGVPKRRGFGSLVLQRDLARSLEGEVDLKFAEDGVLCRIGIPEKHLFPSGPQRGEPTSTKGT